MLVTVRLLEKLNASHSVIEVFKIKFLTNKADVKKVLTWLKEIDQHDWIGWMMGQTPELTQAFLDAGADVHTSDDYALLTATRKGYDKVVELLIKTGADVHANSDYALCWAAERGYNKVVELLIKAGADVHADDDYAFYWATRKGHDKVVELLKNIDT